MGVNSDKGRLFLHFFWRGRRFREYVNLRDTRANRRNLERKMRLIRAQIENDTFDYLAWFPNGSKAAEYQHGGARRDGVERLGDYLERWHRTRSPYRSDGSVMVGRRVLRPSTWQNDGLVIRNRLIPALGTLYIDELSRRQLREFKRQLLDKGGRGGKPLSPKTVNNVMGVLKKALEDAVEDEIIDRNPTPRLDGGGDLRAEPDPFTSDEVGRLLEVIDPAWRGFYRVWFGTGWRPSEIVALRFEWLDWERQMVAIRLGRNPRWGGVEARPKTGERIVDCSYDPRIFATFERQRRAALRAGRQEYVFFDRRGEPLDQEKLHANVFKRAMRVAGVRHRGSYAIRDTFISHAASRGEKLIWIAEHCGTSVPMIERHYAKWMPQKNRDDGQKVAGALFPSSGDGVKPDRTDDGGTRVSVVRSVGIEATPTGFEPVLPA